MTVLMLAAALAASDTSVLWQSSYECTNGIVIDREAAYTVWAWVPINTKADLTLNGQTFAIPATPPAEKKDAYVWVKAGDVNLKPGTIPVSTGEGVASIVLSDVPGYSPANTLCDRRISREPVPVRDRRAETVKHTDTVFAMPEFATKAGWEAFAEPLRRQILLSSGLYPMPEKTPLNPVISGKITHPDYTVENVYFEARPGFYVTGNLYRPTGTGPFPGVACPHGHWEAGRFANEERGSVPGRCITLARMGCVVFSYDMIGYNDSLQFKHQWGGEREKLWGIHPYAFQLWSSIRAIDFLQSLPDVDPKRIGVTGASGGGTQTFSVTAVDPRVTVAAPVNMISCSMQGGCLCENAPILRLSNSNQEIGALAAPRPLLMVSATGDWTCETPRVEYPAIQSIFRLYNAEDHVANVHIDAPHNYNQASREAMYRFFGKWLLGDDDKWANFTEPAFEVEPIEKLRVFPNGLPPNALTSEQIIAQTIDANRAKWAAVLPSNADGAAKFRNEYGPCLASVLGVEIPNANGLALERLSFEERSGYVVEGWTIGRRDAGDAVPAIIYRPADEKLRDSVLLVHGEGKAALAGVDGPGPLVAGLLAQGKTVMAIDAFLLGEHQDLFNKTARLRKGQFMDTFQPTDTGCRVQDVLTALSYLRYRRDLTDTIDVMGLGAAGMWCFLAAAIDPSVRATIVDANQFPAEDDDAWVKTYYVPCLRSIGDVLTATALIAPRGLFITNTNGHFNDAAIQRIYQIAGGSSNFGIASQPVSIDELIKAVK